MLHSGKAWRVAHRLNCGHTTTDGDLWWVQAVEAGALDIEILAGGGWILPRSHVSRAGVEDCPLPVSIA
jgi:hypothetical protein